MAARLSLPAACAAAVAALLGACSSGQTPPVATERGEAIFTGNCAACHQRDGAGIANVYPPLAGSALVNGDAAPLLRWILKSERPASIPPGRYPTAMPAYGWMSDADAAALLTYLRSHFGNTASGVAPTDVARALGR